ncbi:MAG: hypothetical protein WCQ57_11360 [Verrucomicrobiota bacterium]
MINTTPEKHRAFLRRAVSPNLFTCTLHPEFIPGLVIANLMTPCLWEWAEHSGAAGEKENPHKAFAAIQRFLNKKFYHATGQDFAAIWGLQEARHTLDEEERKASAYAMGLIGRSLSTAGQQHPWTLPLIPLLQDGLFPLYVYGTADVLRAHGKRLGKHTLGVTSCLDECVLAASLALAAGVCRWEDVIFVGSPFHYTVFFLTAQGTIWFNAKREIFTRAMWEEQCAGQDEEGRARLLLDKLIIADRLICGNGLKVFPGSELTGNRDVVARAVGEVERFAQARLEWLHPVPEGGGDHVFTGLDVVSADCAGGFGRVQGAVLERAEQGGAPILEAALYMFRHPQFCETEVLHEAAQTNFYTYLRAASAGSVEDVHAVVDSVPGRESFYGPGGRMALPDEVLAFGTGSEAERELLCKVMQEHVRAR